MSSVERCPSPTHHRRRGWWWSESEEEVDRRWGVSVRRCSWSETRLLASNLATKWLCDAHREAARAAAWADNSESGWWRRVAWRWATGWWRQFGRRPTDGEELRCV
ncbi:hypothetical protein Salat_2091100 [Sesamum alatum]|uniref:Uncharacterized protein n=1 Tax=Sesamum alatum TaxID=300844 RepID=A0AAE1Y0B0_9LAMI|nr:hypothetical protein Salat_2091100 [Sesamum alatum]